MVYIHTCVSCHQPTASLSIRCVTCSLVELERLEPVAKKLLAACEAANYWPMPDDCHAACGTCTGCLLRAAIEAAEQERA